MSRDRLWLSLLVAGGVLLVAYALLPPALARTLLHPLAVLLALVGHLVGLRLHRPRPRGPWLLFAAAAGVLLVSTLLASPLLGWRVQQPWHDAHQLLEAAAFVLLVIGGAWMLRRVAPEGDRDTLVEGAVVTVGVFTLLVSLVPLGHGDLRAALALSHLAIAAVLGALTRLLLLGGPRLVSAVLLFAAGVAVTLGDVVRAVAGTGFDGGAVDLLWASAYVLAGAAALHPTMGEVVQRQDHGVELGWVRMGIFTVALLTGPVAMTIAATTEAVPLTMPLLGGAALVGLVLVRVKILHDRRAADALALARRAEQADELARLGQRAAGDAEGEQELVIAARAAVARVVPAAALRVEQVAPAGDSERVRRDLDAEQPQVGAPVDERSTVVAHVPAGASADEHRFLETATTLVASGLARRRADAALRYQARHDPVTGLTNRVGLAAELAAWFAPASAVAEAASEEPRAQTDLAVLVLDLDGFKTINDTLGHHAGDEALAAVAARFRTAVGRGDLLVRYGGDEFMVLAGGISPTQAEALAARLVAALTEPVVLTDGAWTLRVSVGVATGRVTDPPAALLHAADAAMYRAKDRGGSTWVRADPGPAPATDVPARHDLGALGGEG